MVVAAASPRPCRRFALSRRRTLQPRHARCTTRTAYHNQVKWRVLKEKNISLPFQHHWVRCGDAEKWQSVMAWMTCARSRRRKRSRLCAGMAARRRISFSACLVRPSSSFFRRSRTASLYVHAYARRLSDTDALVRLINLQLSETFGDRRTRQP